MAWYDEVSDILQPVWDEFSTGVSNYWYNLTGQTEKTSAYKALMEREDTAYQRAAEDMKKAGLSKFGGVTPASSISAPHSDPVAKALELQQLRGARIANKQAAHDYSVSKKYNIRSNDKNVLGPLDALFNVFFGSGDVKEGVQDLIDWFKSVTGIGKTPSVPKPPATGKAVTSYVPITIDSMPTGSQLGADADKNKAMVLTLDQLQSLQGQSARDWVNTFLVEEGRLGRGKEGNYRSLPSALTSQVDKGFDADLKHFGDNLRSSAYASDKTVVGNLARVLANKYHRSYDDVYKALWIYANGSDSVLYEVK